MRLPPRVLTGAALAILTVALVGYFASRPAKVPASRSGTDPKDSGQFEARSTSARADSTEGRCVGITFREASPATVGPESGAPPYPWTMTDRARKTLAALSEDTRGEGVRVPNVGFLEMVEYLRTRSRLPMETVGDPPIDTPWIPDGVHTADLEGLFGLLLKWFLVSFTVDDGGRLWIGPEPSLAHSPAFRIHRHQRRAHMGKLRREPWTPEDAAARRERSRLAVAILDRTVSVQESAIRGHRLPATLEPLLECTVLIDEAIWTREQPLTLLDGERSAHELLDHLCAQAGLRWELDDGGILVLVTGPKPKSKRCPTCARSFDHEDYYCPYDGSELVGTGK